MKYDDIYVGVQNIIVAHYVFFFGLPSTTSVNFLNKTHRAQ